MAHKVVRTIKSLIETKRKFVFILFAINELIFIHKKAKTYENIS